jgi:hypothetical protein
MPNGRVTTNVNRKRVFNNFTLNETKYHNVGISANAKIES